MIGKYAFSLLLVLPVAALAAGEREKARLDAVREQRSALEQQLKQAESSRAATADQLRETEQAISAVGRKLRVLGDERAAARAELDERERELRQLERQVAVRQTQLAQLLRHQFRPPGDDALASLLAADDPTEMARDRHFLALLSQAKATLIADLRRDAGETRRLAGEVQQRSDRLADLARREEEERVTLRQRQQERKAVLAQISSQIRAQRREIETLRQNEARLGKLIASLAKRTAAKPPPATKKPAAAGKVPSAAPAVEPVNAGGDFARLRGRLLQPVRGSVAARFGARREDGQSLWKGMFFRAAEGSDVRAVASGTVVFADWLRGYGNLVIIDHDDDFLSVYGNNEALLVDVGKKVGAGSTVATVGSGAGGGAGGGGGQPESGLYFELRHQGRAFDPAKWLGSR